MCFDVTIFIVVIGFESFLDLGLVVTLRELLDHERHEFVLRQGSRAVFVGLLHHQLDFVQVHLDAQHFEGVSEFRDINALRAVLVEEVKRIDNLAVLLLRNQLLLDPDSFDLTVALTVFILVTEIFLTFLQLILMLVLVAALRGNLFVGETFAG